MDNNKISELKNILSGFLVWNKARIDCFARLLLALIAVRTVNLREVAVAFCGKALLDSRYRRLRRFFARFQIDNQAIAKWIFKLFLFGDKKIYLTLDRTNWYWGKAKINILVLGVAYEGMSIPLFWQTLPKAGNATAEEHKAMIQQFITVFGKNNIEGVLGDREFGSEQLFSWCIEQAIPFYIRVKDNINVRLLHASKGKLAVEWFGRLQVNTQSYFANKVDVFGLPLFMAVSRSEKGELMVIVTNKDPKIAVACYLRRWEIETLFGCLKSKGFNFENTHMIELSRIEKLVGLLAVAVSWAHKVGEWRAIKKPIKMKQFKESLRPQYSYFRYGLDFIREGLINPLATTGRQLKQCIKLLTPQLHSPGSIS